MKRGRLVGPTQKVRCKGGKHHVDPTRIEGPPRLRTSGSAWDLIALYAKPKGTGTRNSQDARLERLFSKTAKSKK